jgi:hypothetical protein
MASCGSKQAPIKDSRDRFRYSIYFQLYSTFAGNRGHSQAPWPRPGATASCELTAMVLAS